MARRHVRDKEVAGGRTSRRRLWPAAFVTAAVVAATAAASAWMLSGRWLPVRTLKVQGAFANVQPETLRAAVAPFAGRGLLLLDVSETQAALESLPWVKAAEVRRLWPDTVEVRIAEQRPFARWGDKALVNRDGERFAPPRESWPEALPLIEGPQGTVGVGDAVRRYRQMQRALKPLGLRVAETHIDERRAWWLRLGNGIRIMLGREDHFARLRRFVATYGPELAEVAGKIERVDLRYTNGLAVRWQRAGDGVDAG